MHILRAVTTAGAAICALAAFLPGIANAGPAPKRTVGLVVTSWFTAQYNTPHWEECPEGAAIGNDELWLRSLPQDARIKKTDGGKVQPVDGARKQQAVVRGPNGEDVCMNPTVVNDPPLRIIKGKFGYGFNLDGTNDGAPTSKSCKHDKFEDPDTGLKVDNQTYRTLGCILGWRNGNYMEGHPNGERQDSGRGTILIEVTDVDDLENDPDVTVAFYGALDPMPKDSTGKILPFASYHVSGTPQYGAKAKGRIESGQLTTTPVDARLPLYGNNYTGDMFLKDMRLRVAMPKEGEGAPVKALLGGYYDFNKWWDYIQKIEFLLVAGQWNCPQIYQAAKQLADGYPDPQTGECTALSTALTMEALPAFIVHPKNERTVAEAPTPEKKTQLAQGQ